MVLFWLPSPELWSEQEGTDGMQYRRLWMSTSEAGFITRAMHASQEEYQRTGECMAAIIVGKGYLTNEQLVEVLRSGCIPRTPPLSRVEVDDEVIGSAGRFPQIAATVSSLAERRPSYLAMLIRWMKMLSRNPPGYRVRGGSGSGQC